MEVIVVKFRWTVTELIKANRWHHRHRMRPFFRGALWVMAGFLCIAGSAAFFAGELVGGFVAGLGLLMFLEGPVIRPLLVRQQFKKRPDRGVEIELRVSSDGVQARMPHGSSEVEWAAFSKVVGTPDGFLFYSIPQIFHWLPRHGFANEMDFEKMRLLAKSYAPKFQEVA